MFRKLKIAFYVVIGLIALPFVLVAAFIFKRTRKNQIVGSAVCVSRDGFQTATLTFEKPDLNQEVKLFGLVHVGQHDYYREILEQLTADEQAGAKILYERVGKPTDEQVEQLSKPERQVLAAMKNMGQGMVHAADVLGLQYQMDGLEPQKSWINTDVNTLDFLQFIMDNRLAQFVIKRFGELEGLARVQDRLLTTLFNFFIARSQILMVLFMALFVLPKFRKLKFFMLDHRNQVAVDGITEALRENNQVDATWGAAHLPGMATLLADQGFALTNTEWRTAFKFEQQSFLDVAKALYEHTKESLRKEFSLASDETEEAEEAETEAKD